MKFLWTVLAWIVCHPAAADLRRSVGEPDLSDWAGVARVQDAAAVTGSGGTITYTDAGQNRTYFPA